MDEKKLLLKFVAGLIGGGLLGDYVVTKIQNRKLKEAIASITKDLENLTDAIVNTTKDLEDINNAVEDLLERRNNYKEVVNDLLKDEEVAKA